jgi:hypothetical protein
MLCRGLIQVYDDMCIRLTESMALRDSKYRRIYQRRSQWRVKFLYSLPARAYNGAKILSVRNQARAGETFLRDFPSLSLRHCMELSLLGSRNFSAQIFLVALEDTWAIIPHWNCNFDSFTTKHLSTSISGIPPHPSPIPEQQPNHLAQ